MTSEDNKTPVSEAETRLAQNASAPNPGAPLVGRTIGNFHVTAELGHGAFGNVYKATDTALGRDVALKFLRNPLDGSVKMLFEREARAIAALSKHPGIVDIYHWGEFEGQHYFALEYVDSSAERLLEEHPDGLPVPTVLSLFAHCAEALATAHKENILHRDIKPANILVDSATMTAKVADFGLARFRQSTEFTLNGLISGSPPYMSPEQAKGETLDARSDIFSLGVSFYEMLCGKRPFDGDTIEEVLAKVRGNDRIPFKTRRPDIHAGICHVVEKATAHNPAERYQSAADFARALRIALTALERSGAVPDSLFENEDAAETGKRVSLPLVLGGAAVAVLLCAAGFMMLGGGDEKAAGVKDAGGEVASAPVLPPASTPAPAPVESTREVVRAAASPEEAIEAFCAAWSRAEFEAMYGILSAPRRAGMTLEEWREALEDDQRIMGLPASYIIESALSDNGARSSWTVKITFVNNQVGELTKRTDVVTEGGGYVIDRGGLGPFPKGGF